MTAGAVRDLHFDLSGVGIRLFDLPESIAATLESTWRPFVVARVGSPVVDLRVEATAVASFPGEFAPKAMRADLTPHRARYEMAEGRVEIDAAGSGSIEIGMAEGQRSYYGLINLVRAALAWRMPSRGGALLHAAGIVLRDRAFVLTGPAGSGKSSWARLAMGVGARVLSDDLVLIDGSAGLPECLGAPFRSTHEKTVGPGRWPLAAILFPDHGEAAGLAEVAGLEARARLLANLPFVGEGLGHDPSVAELIEGLLGAVPARVLTFSLDPGFVGLLDSFEG